MILKLQGRNLQYKMDKQEKQKYKTILESILFTIGDSVELAKLAEVIEQDESQTKELLLELKSEYEKSKRGMTIVQLENSFQMCSSTDMYEYLIKIVKTPRKYILTEALLETLSIVAYKQPVTKMEIEKIRGVSCEHAVNRLLDFELIMEVGRKDAPGRPILLGTTEQFLRSFGVNSLTDLPEMNIDQMAEFREEAEKEVQLKLDI